METGIGDFYTVCQHMYDKIRERYVRASITQAAIRDGVGPRPTHTGRKCFAI